MAPVTHPGKIRTAALFAGLALLALAIRLPHLGARPMHTDESINAYITGQLLAGEPFRYDPVDRHGPALSAMVLPIVRAFGVRGFSDLTEAEVRMGPVVAGAATVLLFFAGCRVLGLGASLVAAASFAFASMPVYYSRYFIHETLFVAATLALILSILSTVKSHSLAAAGMAGLSAALMLACKETAVLHFFALGISALVVFRIRPAFPPRPASAWKAAFAAVIFAGVVIALFTWFGNNWQGLASLPQCVPGFLRRAGGEGHEKPLWYFLALLGGGGREAFFWYWPRSVSDALSVRMTPRGAGRVFSWRFMPRSSLRLTPPFLTKPRGWH